MAYAEDVRAAMTRHPSGNATDSELDQGWAAWAESLFDPDDPYGTDRLEDLEL